MTNRNRLTIITTGACLLGALTACTTPSPNAGHPETTPPSTPATTPTASTPPTPATAPPTRPAAGTGLTLAAADSFVRYYVDLLNYASKTGDTQPLLSASESGCRQCKVYADYVTRVNAANGGLSGDYFERVKDIPELFRGDGGRVGGSALVTIGGYTSKESPSAKPVTSAAQSYKREFTLAPQQNEWVMYEMKLVRQ